ncbi:MAG: (2Fe-2S)-binding protein [Planctomycetes bacterium]|nr:(2Fe-2S)-binding protein [Planctomycetota bacterium]
MGFVVRFLPEGKAIEVEKPSTLLEIALHHGLIISFGCGVGQCGTDLVTIVEGMPHILPPTPSEQETLAHLRAGPDERLACVATATGDVTVDISPRLFPRGTGPEVVTTDH